MTNPLRRSAPAAVAAVVGLGLVAGCGSSSGTTTTTGAGAKTSPAATATTSAPATPTTSAAAVSGKPSGLVYWLVKTPQGDRITAEQAALGKGDPIAGAVKVLDAGKPVDPDYSAAVPPGSLASASVEKGKQIDVTLAGSQWAKVPSGTSAATAELAQQAVVYTLNAANGTAAKPLPVQFTLGGKPSTYLGQPATAKPANQLKTLALMSVLAPTDGATLKAGKTTFSGVGSSFEANVAWQVQDSSGKAVLHGSTMSSGWMDKLYPWKATVDLSKLSPGTYTFVASTDSGGEGPAATKDTKRFTIK
ncbi:MAG: hypothetical protein FWE71_10865 [Nocardioidaceae bacterium]|nr:hypothetical protein [Nocardioidaceae bacterium]MCL2611885.1 hypothetical protein [Nocardioidaceae bacterium]